jgi:SAM-dependent methyltransferase
VSGDTGYVDAEYLKAAAALVHDAKKRSYRMMRAGPGSRVLDVGCGPGTDTVPLAEIVGPRGAVAGVDHDAEMLAAADRRAAEAGVAAHVTHHRADANRLPFADASFDAVRCERLLLHLARPEGALAEMVRVTRPGGWVVVVDTDWASRSVDTPEVEAERVLARVLAERCLVNGHSGRRLYGLCREAGLEEVEVNVHPTIVTRYGLWRMLSRMEMAEAEAVRGGLLTEEEVARLDASLRAKDEAGSFFAITSLVLVAGGIPSDAHPMPRTPIRR